MCVFEEYYFGLHYAVWAEVSIDFRDLPVQFESTIALKFKYPITAVCFRKTFEETTLFDEAIRIYLLSRLNVNSEASVIHNYHLAAYANEVIRRWYFSQEIEHLQGCSFK